MSAAHFTRTEEEKRKLAAEVIDYLNELVGLDPEALHTLMETRVPCNEAISEHGTTQVSDGPTVGALGLLNGLVGVRSNQWGYIAAVYDDETGKLIRFDHSEAHVPSEMHPDVGDKPVLDVDAEMIINGNRRKFVDRVQYYLNELLEDDHPQHVMSHIESECEDYRKLIRDAVKVYGTGYPKPQAILPGSKWKGALSGEVVIQGSDSITTAWVAENGSHNFMDTKGFLLAFTWVSDDPKT